MNGIYNTECNKSMSDFSEERKQELFTSMEILVMNCLKENTDNGIGFITPNEDTLYKQNPKELFKAIEHLTELRIIKKKNCEYVKRQTKSGMRSRRSEKTVETLVMILTARSLRSTAIRTGNCSEIHRRSRNGRSHTNIRRKKRKRNCLILNFPLEGPEGSHRLPCLSRCACVERLFQGQHCTIRISLMI